MNPVHTPFSPQAAELCPGWVLQLRPAFAGHPAFEPTYYAGYSVLGEPARTFQLREAARFHEEAAIALSVNLLGTLSCTWEAVKVPAAPAPAVTEDAGAAKDSNEPVAREAATPEFFEDLWGGDRFRLADGSLWTKLSVATARRHSRESCALNERGFGYIGDTICGFERKDEVTYEPAADLPEREELVRIARQHGWSDTPSDKSLTSFFRSQLKSALISETCTPAPAGGTGPVWACYDCGYSGQNFRTVVQRDNSFDGQCPSCEGMHTDEASVVLRELVATVDDLREQVSAESTTAQPGGKPSKPAEN